MKRVIACATLLAASLTLVSCGGDSNPAGPTGNAASKLTLQPNREAPLLIASTLVPVTSAPFNVNAASVVPFTVTFNEVGVYQIGVDWADTSNDLDLYLTDTNCLSEAQLRAGGCYIYAKDDSFVKPAYVNVQVTSAPAVAYLYIHDVGPFSDNGIVQLSIVR
jgi:hypothetical protein